MFLERCLKIILKKDTNNCKLSPLIKNVLYLISLFLFILFCFSFAVRWFSIVLLSFWECTTAKEEAGWKASAQPGSPGSGCWRRTVLYVWTECIIDVKPKIYLRNIFVLCPTSNMNPQGSLHQIKAVLFIVCLNREQKNSRVLEVW